MKKLVSFIAAGALAFALGCSSQRANQSEGTASNPLPGTNNNSQSSTSASSTGTKLSSSDSDFVNKAAQGGMAEVQLGQMVAQKAQNQAVKDFAQRMVDDHSKANDQLKQLASQKGINLPTDLDSSDKQFQDKLSSASGASFDKMYMDHMVQDHKKDVSEFQSEADKASDPDVKSFAQQTLPTLQQHLQLAQQTDKQVKGGK
jgi:putative membrane protein